MGSLPNAPGRRSRLIVVREVSDEDLEAEYRGRDSPGDTSPAPIAVDRCADPGDCEDEPCEIDDPVNTHM